MDLRDLRQTADLRALVPVTEARRRFGRYDIELCPFHADTNPSLLLFSDGYHCQACGKRGDVFDYFYRANGMRIGEVLKLAGKVGPLPKTEAKKIRNPNPNLGLSLHFKITPEIMQYYSEKLGFDANTVVKFQLGYGCLPGKTVSRFTIPVYEHGKLINVRARRDDRCPVCLSSQTTLWKKDEIYIQCAEHKTVHPDPDASQKYIQCLGAKQALFNADILDEWAEKPGDNNVLFLVEGEYKAIILEQYGYKAVSFGNATGFNLEWVSRFVGVNKLWVLGDGDKAGTQSAFKIWKAMPQAKVVFIKYGEKGDVVDFLKEHPIEDFFSIVRDYEKKWYNDPAERLIRGML